MEIELRRGHVVALGVAVVLLGTAVVYYITRPKPTPWLEYPADPQALVTQFMKLIQEDTVAAHNKAYALVNLPDRQKDDEAHLQEYHEVHRYLSPLFGSDWAARMTVVPVEPGKTYEVRIGTERLHVDVIKQGPPEGPPTEHYGIVAIREFPLDEGPAAAQMAAITSILGGVAGKGATDNLNVIVAGGGNYARLSKMQMKRVALPVAMDPNTSVRQVILHLYPVRDDPTVKACLQTLIDDQRFTMESRNTAKEVLEGTVPLEDLIAAGVPG